MCFDYVLIALISFTAVLLVWIFFTHGVSGRYVYYDKRKKHVSLHLLIYKTPRQRSGASAVAISLRSVLRTLKLKGYHTVLLESHLIDSRSLHTLRRLLKREGIKIDELGTRPTPKLHVITIKASMLFCKQKFVSVNPVSTRLIVTL